MKQKLFFVIFAFLVAITVHANGTEIDGIYYLLDSSTKTASVTYTGVKDLINPSNPSSTAYTGSITIPASVTYYGTTYTVTSIGDLAFDGCTGLASISIPSSVTYIGGWAFKGCTGLASIKVEAGNTAYDSRENCNAIIETASNTLVAGCMNTTIPNSVTSIGSSAFEGCTGLASISIPSTVTKIGNYAFEDCTGLTSISIPNSVTSIGSSAFEGCTGLASISIPSSVTYIRSSAFSGCTGLTSINIPESVTIIGASAFQGCTGLTSISIPSSVTYIGGWAFEGCTGLTSITIPASVTVIDYYAFEGCTGLTSLTIPASVTSIGDEAFYGCTGLTSIKVEAGNTAYDSRENCNAIIETASNTLIAGCMNTTIPNSVTAIGKNAFEDCTGLTSISIPASVTKIGGYAFYGCTGLASIKVEEGNTAYDSRENCNAIIVTASNRLVAGCMNTTIPNSVTKIGDNAFKGCTGLTSINIPNSVTSIGYKAFYGCTGLTSLTIPASVTTIEYGAFTQCTGLASIKVEEGNTAYDSRENCNAIIVTASNRLVAGCMNTTIPNSVTKIGDNAFKGCTGLTSINIPNSVTSIGSSAFEGCTGLTSINIPNSVTKIGDNAFKGCTGLTDIYALRTDPAAYNCYDFAFDDVPFSTCTLHVPNGSKEAYAATAPWSDFMNIVEYDASGIEPIGLTPTEADAASYYNLQGQRIARPQRGQIVIQRNADGTSRKVLVK